jgi:signal transduction histidine kinase/CheY-like chemotaxis protein
MKFVQRFSLRGKLTLVSMLTTVAALLLASVTFLAYDAHSFRQRTVRDLEMLSQVIGDNCQAPLLFNDVPSAAGVLAALAAKPAVESALLYRPSGELFAQYASPHRGTAIRPLHLARDGHQFNDGRLVLGRTVFMDGEAIGRLVVVSDLRELRQRLVHHGLVVALVLLLACVAAFFLSNAIQPLVSLPILRLAQAARTVAERQDFSIRVPEEGRDEIAQTARAFNGMLVQIENRDNVLHATRVELEGKVAQLEAEVAERRRVEEALHHSEEQLLQAQKMEAIGRLAGGVAHDFNNLLTVIRGQGDLLARRIGEGSPNRRGVEEILKAADRAAGLTRQLLAFSRKQMLAPKVLDAGVVVADLGSMLSRLIGENIELVIRMPEGLGHVKIDPGQLEQVMMNLAVNARDAMPEGGRLVLGASNVRRQPGPLLGTDEVPAGDYVALTVTDTGCGMSREVLARVFEPFYTTKPKGQGTGLGLSMVYGIVRQSEGHITVYSEPGVGTTFKVYLPRVDAAQEVPAPPAVPRGDLRGRGETILVVEDEALVLDLITETLGEAGYRVLPAPDGATALEIVAIHDGDIHLALTDMIMPGMNGKEVALGLGRLRPGLQVLYMSGYSDTGIVHDGYLDEGVAFLQKPFSPVELLERIHDLLHRGSADRAAA